MGGWEVGLACFGVSFGVWLLSELEKQSGQILDSDGQSCSCLPWGHSSTQSLGIPGVNGVQDCSGLLRAAGAPARCEPAQSDTE